MPSPASARAAVQRTHRRLLKTLWQLRMPTPARKLFRRRASPAPASLSPPPVDDETPSEEPAVVDLATTSPDQPLTLFGDTDALPPVHVAHGDSLRVNLNGDSLASNVGEYLNLAKLSSSTTVGGYISWLTTYHDNREALAAFDPRAPSKLVPSSSLPRPWRNRVLHWGRDEVKSGRLPAFPQRLGELEFYTVPWVRYKLRELLRLLPLEDFADTVSDSDVFPVWDLDTAPAPTQTDIRYHLQAVDTFITSVAALRGPLAQDHAVRAALLEHQLARLFLLSIRPRALRNILESQVAEGASRTYFERTEVHQVLLNNLLASARAFRRPTPEAAPTARLPRTSVRPAAPSRALVPDTKRTSSSDGPAPKRARSTPLCLICAAVNVKYPLSKLDTAHMYVDCPLSQNKLSRADRDTLVRPASEEARTKVVEAFLRGPGNLQHASIKRGASVGAVQRSDAAPRAQRPHGGRGRRSSHGRSAAPPQDTSNMGAVMHGPQPAPSAAAVAQLLLDSLPPPTLAATAGAPTAPPAMDGGQLPHPLSSRSVAHPEAPSAPRIIIDAPRGSYVVNARVDTHNKQSCISKSLATYLQLPLEQLPSPVPVFDAGGRPLAQFTHATTLSTRFARDDGSFAVVPVRAHVHDVSDAPLMQLLYGSDVLSPLENAQLSVKRFSHYVSPLPGSVGVGVVQMAAITTSPKRNTPLSSARRLGRLLAALAVLWVLLSTTLPVAHATPTPPPPSATTAATLLTRVLGGDPSGAAEERFLGLDQDSYAGFGPSSARSVPTLESARLPPDFAPHEVDFSTEAHPTPAALQHLHSALTTLYLASVNNIADAGRAGFTDVTPFDAVQFDQPTLDRLRHVWRPLPSRDPRLLTGGTAIIDSLLSAGVVTPAPGQVLHSVPAMPIPKGPDAVRLVFDYTTLNTAVRSSYQPPAPSLRNAAHLLHGANAFLTVDLVSAYHQAPISERLSSLLAFSFNGRTYFPLTSPPGFAFAGAALSHSVRQIYCDLIARPGSGMLPYEDDFLLYAPTVEQLAVLIDDVNARHARHRVRVSRKKFRRAASSTTWGGYLVRPGQFTLDATRLHAPSPPLPTSLADLQRQIGSLVYFLHCVPDLGEHVRVLQHILTEQMRANNVASRSSTALRRYALRPDARVPTALRAAWAAVAARPFMVSPPPDHHVVIVTDASQLHGYSAVYLSVSPEQWAQYARDELVFARLDFDFLGATSGTWTDAQLSWTPARLEYMASVNSILHAPYAILEGRRFHVITDNIDNSIWLQRERAPDLTSTQANWVARWFNTLARFDFDVYYEPGESSALFLADFLSRAPGPARLGLPNAALASSSVSATTTFAAPHLNVDGPLSSSFSPPTLAEIASHSPDGVLRRSDGRVIVPDAARLRERIAVLAHASVHHGQDTTLLVIHQAGLTWPGIERDIQQFVRACLHCAVQGRAPLQYPDGAPPHGTTFNDVIMMDHVHLGRSSNGQYSQALLITDTFSRFTVTVPVADLTGLTTVATLASHWVRYFGVPRMIVSDQGSSFANHHVETFAQVLGTRQHTTVPHRPQAHGLVERRIRHVRALLASLLAANGAPAESWPAYLPLVDATINHTPLRTLGGHSPFTVMSGRRARDGLSVALPTSMEQGTLARATPPPAAEMAELVAQLDHAHNHIDASTSQARNTRRDGVQRNRALHSRLRALPDYAVGSHVLVADYAPDPHRPRWTQLGRILTRESDYVYEVELIRFSQNPSQATRVRRHIGQLRPLGDVDFGDEALIDQYLQRFSNVEYPVENILDVRPAAGSANSFELHIRWAGYPDESAQARSWEPLSTIASDMPTFTRDYFTRLADSLPTLSAADRRRYSAILTAVALLFPRLVPRRDTSPAPAKRGRNR